MSSALALLKGLKQKVHRDDYQDCRILQVDMPLPSSVDIEFRDLTLKVSEGIKTRRKKTILKEISGLFRSGELTAIMGPSGAGKSSLMNALTGFSTQGVTGTLRAGDSICNFSNKKNALHSLKTYRKKSCYILQDDRLNPLFTVSELMKFATDLKLGETLTEKLKSTVISDILETLGLSGCENTRCGNLSGGQKKRLSIAVELIDNPPVVFLDEPTTGLDSLSSTQCVEMLKNLARSGRTVVCTIHQPSASIYNLFDQVYILSDGMCLYNGSSENTVPYLASVGFQCPVYHNPADYILEIAAGEYGNVNDMLSRACRKQDWCEKSAPQTIATAKSGCFSYGKTTIAIKSPTEMYKFKILFKRAVIQQYRDWTVTHLKVALHIVIGILLGLLFTNAGSDGSKSVSNMGYLLMCVVYLCYTSMMPAVLRFPQELPVIKKENFNNWYNLKTYYAAIMITTIPVQIWYSFVYSLPSYLLSGQPLEIYRFVLFVLILSFNTVLADSYGNIIGTCVNPINGTFLAAIYTSALILFAGFLVLISHMSQVMKFISNMSFLRQALEGLMLSVYAYDRKPLECPETKDYCHLRYPKEIIGTFDFKYDNYWIDIAILAAEVIVIRVLAFWTLKRNVKRSH